jgi:hypothetical protein
MEYAARVNGKNAAELPKKNIRGKYYSWKQHPLKRQRAASR